MEQAKQSHYEVTPKGTTIVRVGNRSWRIGEPLNDSPSELDTQTLHRVAPTRQETKKGIVPRIQELGKRTLLWCARSIGKQVRTIPVTFRESFQLGAIFGLALGSLSLFFFHQMQSSAQTQPANGSASIGSVVGVGAEQSQSQMAIPESSETGIQLPGLTLYSLEFGDVANEHEANDMKQELMRKGLASYVDKQDSSWLVLSNLAVQPDDLQPMLSKYAALKPSIYSRQQNALMVPVLATTSSIAANQTQEWLSAEASAILSLTAVVSDGENTTDAIAAYANQQKLYPGDDVIAETGLSMWLVNLSNHVEMAYYAVLHHRTLAAESALAMAADEFAQLSTAQL